MLNLVSPVGHPTIAPALTREERVTYVTREIEQIKELLEDYGDVQLIYEALIDYTIFSCQFQERKPDGSEKAEIAGWLEKLRKLDPMRAGRWADLERDCELDGERPRPVIAR